MSKAYQKLIKVMERLRSDRGCPWDREQTRETLKPFLIEETYEVIEAIDKKDPENLKEELGDLLFQVVFHAQIAKERGEFDIEEVLNALTDKMVRRHPHVFGKDRAGTAQQVLARWEKLKNQEEKNRKRKSVLDGVPKHLPSLLRANQLQGRAARVGFDWPNVRPVWKKIREELRELQESIRQDDPESIEAEFGDLLFSLVNLSRYLKIDSEGALRKANRRFSKRFQFMERKAVKLRRPLSELSLKELDRLWEEAKREERKRSAS